MKTFSIFTGRKQLLLLIFLLLTFSLLSTLNMNIKSVSAVDSHTISVVPGTISDPTLTVGKNFTVDIYSDYTGSDIHRYYFTLTYDPDVIRGGLKGYDTWVADGSTTEWNTTHRVHFDSEKVYVNSLLKIPIMQGNDTWVGDNSTAVYETSESPWVQYSEEVRVDSVLKTRAASKEDIWLGNGSTVFTTTYAPVKPGSELNKVWMNATDTWTGDGTTTMFNTTYTPIIDGTEIVRLDGVLMNKTDNYTITYGTGAINFTEGPPSNGVEVKAQYKIRLLKPANYTIDYDTGVITFAEAPLTGEDVKVSYEYGHYEETYTTGTVVFFSNTIPGVSAAIEITYSYPVYTIEHHYDLSVGYWTTLVFEHAPAAASVIEIDYLYGGVTNGELIPIYNDVGYGYGEEFNPGQHNITEGKLLLTWAKTYVGYYETGPDVMANVTFQVVGIGRSNITLGVETRLENSSGPIPTDQLEHGYFDNVTPVGWINGTVTDADSGLPIAGASITAAGYSTVTNGSGTYELGVEPGNYTVTASLAGYESSQTNVTVAVDETVTVDFELSLLLGAIAGTVTDASTGEVIVGATVIANGYSDTTDVYGHYNLTDVPVGTFTVNASATGYENASQTSITVLAEAITTVNFTLHALEVNSTISISADPATITVGESTTISGSISPTRTGVNVTIQYMLSGEQTWNNLTTVTTNASSQYSHVWTPETAGTYEFKAKWLGDENTLPAESNKQTITVEEVPPEGIPLYIPIAIAAVAVIIIATVFYFFKIRK